MSLFRRFSTQPRLFGEVRFALGAALVMGGAGAMVALATPPLRALPEAHPALRWLLQAAIGFGLGWWGGLLWGVALAAHARRFRPAPPLPALMRAAWFAGALIAAGSLLAYSAGLSVLFSIGVGVVAATAAARVTVGRAARRAAA